MEIDLISMKSALFALKRIEVRGEYAKTYGNAIEVFDRAVKVLENARKEAEKHADHDKQEQDV